MELTKPPPNKTQRILIGCILALLTAGGVSWLIPDPDFPTSLNHNSRASCVLQIQWTAWGLVAGVVGASIDYRRWQKWALFLLVCSVSLMVLSCLKGKYSFEHSGAQRMFLFKPIDFPPSELAKFATVVFFGALATATRSRCRKLDIQLLPPALLLMILMFLSCAAGNIGDAFLITVTGSVFLFQAGRNPWGALVVGYVVLGFVLTCLGWDVYHPHYGTMFLRNLLEQPVRAVMLVGMVVVFIVIIISGFRVSADAPDRYGKMLALGISLLLALQGLLHAYGYISFGFMLRAGQPVPLLGNNGYRLASSLLQIGVLFNISRQSVMALENDHTIACRDAD